MLTTCRNSRRTASPSTAGVSLRPLRAGRRGPRDAVTSLMSSHPWCCGAPAVRIALAPILVPVTRNRGSGLVASAICPPNLPVEVTLNETTPRVFARPRLPLDMRAVLGVVFHSATFHLLRRWTVTVMLCKSAQCRTSAFAFLGQICGVAPRMLRRAPGVRCLTCQACKLTPVSSNDAARRSTTPHTVHIRIDSARSGQGGRSVLMQWAKMPA